GFGRGVVTDVRVEVGGTASVNITLEVGALEVETVVTADTAQQIINTVDAELSIVVDDKRVLELPLNGRNASELALLQAGVYYETTATGEGNKLIIHGQRHSSLNITLDGLDTQDNFNRASSIMINQPLIALSAENVQEFKVSTGNTSAEYSRGGAHISAVTRSGSNDWHGSLFYFHRNDVFSANDFFNNAVGQETPKRIRHQFGGRIGGPIVKDKTFFFFGYQQTRDTRGIPVNRTVWSAKARQGIFQFLDGTETNPANVLSGAFPVFEIDLLRCDPTADSADECLEDRFLIADPIVALDPAFGYDRITLDPLVAQIIAAMPLPNDPTRGDGLNTQGFRFNSVSKTFEHLPAFRLDHVFSPKHSFYATFNYTDRNIVGDFVNGRERIWPSLDVLGTRTTLSKAFGAGLTSTFSPTMVNQFRWGVVAGENAFNRQQPFDTPFTLDFDDISDPYNPGGASGTARDNETWHLRDTVSWVRGKHQFKFGGEWRHRYVNNRNHLGTEAWGEIDFNDSDFRPGWRESNILARATSASGTGAGNMTSDEVNDGEELNNNLIGAIGDIEARFNVTDVTSGFVPLAGEIRTWESEEFDFFFNDTWQVSPRLTLTMGLRWEYASIPDETNGLILLPQFGEDAVFGVSGQQGFFNPGTLAGTPCPSLGALPITPNEANVLALIDECAIRNELAGGSTGIKLWEDDYNNLGPVLSLAWDPWGDGKTAIRAGYRISYYQDAFAMVEDHVDDNEGLKVFGNCEPSDPNLPCQNVDPDVDLAALLRNITAAPLPPTPTFALPAGPPQVTFLNSTSQDFRTFVKGLETPYYQEWNLSVSRELWGNTAFEVRYVGNRGLKLRRAKDFNEVNVHAFDPVTGMTFVEAFEIAQINLACNRLQDGVDDFSERGNACNVPNPLMNDLIAGDPSRLDDRGDMIDALDTNGTADFIHEFLYSETSRPDSGLSTSERMRGGSFWGQVLNGRFPINFFNANPFVASSRRMTNDGFSTYHALEIEARRRLSQGLMFQANYTFGKALSDFDGDSNTLVNDTRASSAINPRYSTSQIMPRHQFNANWVWELPIGQGRALIPESAAARKLLGGWQLGGIIRMRSGRPISITSNVGTFHRQAIADDNTVNLAQGLSNEDLRNLTGLQTISGALFWIDPTTSRVVVSGDCVDPAGASALFQCPRPGELGTLGHTPIYGPSRFTLDFNLAKRTQITETVDLEFRWEVFNATNTPNFNIPTLNIASESFG
ncbi:MAG: TonB-dependent receptor, partial [Acidimicrobiia bacterium]